MRLDRILLGLVFWNSVWGVRAQTLELRHLYFNWPKSKSKANQELILDSQVFFPEQMVLLGKLDVVLSQLETDKDTQCSSLVLVLNDLRKKTALAKYKENLPSVDDLRPLLSYAIKICGSQNRVIENQVPQYIVQSESGFGSDYGFSQKLNLRTQRTDVFSRLARVRSVVALAQSFGNSEFSRPEWEVKLENGSEYSGALSHSLVLESQRSVDIRNSNAWSQNWGLGSGLKIGQTESRFSLDLNYDSTQSLGRVYDSHQVSTKILQGISGSLEERVHSWFFEYEKTVPKSASLQNGSQNISTGYQVQGLVGAGANGRLKLGFGEFRNSEQVLRFYPKFELKYDGRFYYRNFLGLSLRPTFESSYGYVRDLAADYVRQANFGVAFEGRLTKENHKLKLGLKYLRSDSLSSLWENAPFILEQIQMPLSYEWQATEAFFVNFGYTLENRVYTGPELDDTIEGLRISHLKDGVKQFLDISLKYVF